MIKFLRAWLVYNWGGAHRFFGIQNGVSSEFGHAVRYFTKALEIDPSFRRVRLERGVLLFRELNRPDEALADFNALLDEDPEYAPALFNRALLHQQHGRFTAALQDLQTYLTLPDSHEYASDARHMIITLQQLLTEEE